MALESDFLGFSARKLAQLSSRIEDCLRRLTPEQVWSRAGDNQNAVGNLVLHLSGNVRQWIVSGVGGAADVRDRDAEFAARGGAPAADLAALLSSTVGEAAAILDGLAPGRLTERLRIQGYDVTVLEAIYACVEHFSHHTGQILYATKLFSGADLGYYAHLRRPSHSELTP